MISNLLFSCKLIRAHTWTFVLEHLRQPSYVVLTLLFPALFFLFFATPNAETAPKANFLMGSFSAFAVIGVVFFQFGVGLAADRRSDWFRYLRTLPLPSGVLFMSRTLAALFFAAFAVLAVVAAAWFATPLDLAPDRWARFLIALFAGSLPFAALGLALAFWASPRNALPMANLIYLPLSFAGGLWTPPQTLPLWIGEISAYLPTRHYGEVIWQAVLGSAWSLRSWLFLAGYTLIFAAAALWAWRREQRSLTFGTLRTAPR